MSESFMKTYYQNFNNPALVKNLKDNIQKNLNLILDKFSANDQKVFTKPWGWKDPRNSPNLYFWLNVFPEAKILMIEKKESHKRSKSPSGNWFRQATEYQKQFYYNPTSGVDLSSIQDDKILKVSFEDLTSNQECLDKVTYFCRIEKVNLQTTLRLCNYEK